MGSSLVPYRPGALVGYTVEENGCWEWRGARSWGGYGRCGVAGERRTAQAHRVVYEAHRGTIPAGHDLDHLCRNRGCVNPAHMEPVTRLENARRGAKMKLTDDQVAQIRARYAAGGITTRALASEYGIDNGYVSQLLHGKRRATPRED